jgi:hypothetical protein
MNLSKKSLEDNVLDIAIEFSGLASYLLHLVEEIIIKGHYTTNLSENQIKKISTDFEKICNDIVLNYSTDINKVKLPNHSNSSLLQIKTKLDSFVTKSQFKAYVRSCSGNGFQIKYSIENLEEFSFDALKKGIDRVTEIIHENNSNLISYKLCKNRSPYISDINNCPFDTLEIYLTLNGIVLKSEINELLNSGKILDYVKGILNDKFEILSQESINDDFDPDYIISSQYKSSLIVGQDLTLQNLYNQYTKSYHKKVMRGNTWHHDDLHGPSFRFLNYHSPEHLSGEYGHSIPFENVLSNYYITYLERSSWEKDLEELNCQGYSVSGSFF